MTAVNAAFRDARREVALAGSPFIRSGVKLVKQQINGDEQVVLKVNASLDDLKAEVSRLQTLLGYEVRPDKRRGRYLATHNFFSGKFVLFLDQD